MKEETDTGWAPVFTGSMTEAQIVKGLLETNDIPVNLEYEAIGKIYGLTVDGLGKVVVLVPSSMLNIARALLERDNSQDQ